MKHIERFLDSVPALTEDVIQVFLIKTGLFNHNECVKYLSDAECNRAEKLKIESSRTQFIITRSLLRRLLATTLHIPPKAIDFSYAQHGKPYINNTIDNKPVQFNVSHSGGYALIALTLNNKVGVDIERLGTKTDYQSLVDRFFSVDEKNGFRKLEEKEKPDLFYRLWVRKESFIKAVGDGVAYGLDKFSVALDSENNATQIITGSETGRKWYCTDLATSLKHHTSAITTNRNDVEINIHAAID